MTEACVLTANHHSVSIFSRIHSSMEKNFTSINNITSHNLGTNGKVKSRLLLFIKAKNMMLATNKKIKAKEDVVKVANAYFSQSPAPVGLMKAPLIAELRFQNFQKIGLLVLR